MDIIFNTIGILGMAVFLASFFLLQRGKLTSHDPGYLWMNLVGAVAIIISLFWSWNLPSFLLETAWGLISAWSLLTLKRTHA